MGRTVWTKLCWGIPRPSVNMLWKLSKTIQIKQLFHCLKGEPQLNEVERMSAFRWALKPYQGQDSALFPSVMTLPVAPFQGMADQLLLANGVAVMCAVDESSIEVRRLKDEYTYKLTAVCKPDEVLSNISIYSPTFIHS